MVTVKCTVAGKPVTVKMHSFSTVSESFIRIVSYHGHAHVSA